MNRATPFPWATDGAEPGAQFPVEISPETGDRLLFRNVFRNAPVAIARCTSAGQVASANPAFEGSLGIDLRGGSAVPLSDCIQPKDREETDDWFREMIAGSRESFQIENQLLNQNAQNQSAQEMGGARGSGSWVRLIDEHIELVCQLNPNPGAVRRDSAQAQQILLNLVLNARDALPEGGRITLETRNFGLQIVTSSALEKTAPVELPCALFVVSNGQGRDSQTQQHVFEAFFSTKPPGEGAGLGLSTVDEIVTNNGGLIHLESERRKGTRVTVLLPLPLPPIPLPLISPAEISAAELPNVSSGDSKHQTSKRH
jgi:PAS domain-containing protein